jgi:hypothetical protein
MLFSPYYFGEPLFYMDWKPILDKSDCAYETVKFWLRIMDFAIQLNMLKVE